MKLSAIIEDWDDNLLRAYSKMCALALARAHARSGDAAKISGYMGSSETFDDAICEFAVEYADQTQRDYRAFVKAVGRDGSKRPRILNMAEKPQYHATCVGSSTDAPALRLASTRLKRGSSNFARRKGESSAIFEPESGFSSFQECELRPEPLLRRDGGRPGLLRRLGRWSHLSMTGLMRRRKSRSGSEAGNSPRCRSL